MKANKILKKNRKQDDIDTGWFFKTRTSGIRLLVDNLKLHETRKE